jgi:hypothetical protein
VVWTGVFVARTWVGRCNLFVWEENIFNELLAMINVVAFSSEINVWGWGPKNGEVFTVNSIPIL